MTRVDNAFEILSLTAFVDFQNFVRNDQSVVRFVGQELLQLEGWIGGLYREYEENGLGREPVMKSYITILLSFIFRKMSCDILKDAEAANKIPADILDYIETHYNEKFSLTQLAEKSFYKPAYFSTMFKECYGLTLTDYLQRKQIEQGCKLLLETDLPAEKIGRQVGYEDNVRFYQYFKKICGVTPNIYRKTKTTSK